MMQKTAIILGATGLTGGILLKKLIRDPEYKKIILFSRRESGEKNPKIEEHIVDLFELAEHKEKFKADEVFCCVGTTKKETLNKQVYRKVDLGIPVTAAKLCKENNIQTFLVISALGANAKSKIFYNRIKGEMEEVVLQQGLQKTFILQPSLIAGDREETRPLEFIGNKFMKVANYLLLGPLKKYRSIHPATIAEAMIKVARNGYRKPSIESDEIKIIAGKND